jgi:hypothetical protein
MRERSGRHPHIRRAMSVDHVMRIRYADTFRRDADGVTMAYSKDDFKILFSERTAVSPAKADSAVYGSVQRWLAWPLQSPMIAWVPEPPDPLSARHLPDCGLTRAPFGCGAQVCAPVPLQS